MAQGIGSCNCTESVLGDSGSISLLFPPWTEESPSKFGKQARGTAYWERSPHNSGLMNRKEVRTMAGICKLCVYFRANVHPGKEKPHHCAALDQALSEEQAEKVCEEQKVT